MSGPKCAAYSVDGAAIARALRRDMAVARRDDLSDRLNALEIADAARRARGLREVFKSQISRLRDNASIEELEAWNTQVATLVAGAEADLAEAERGESQDEFRRRFAMAASGNVAEEVRRRAVADRQHAQASRHSVGEPDLFDSSVESIDRSAEITALIDMLPVGMSAEEGRTIDDGLSRLAEASLAEFGSYLIAIKAEMQSIRRAIADRLEMKGHGEELLASLEGLSGIEIDASRALLRRVVTGETTLLDTDVAVVARARSAAAAESERRFVASKIEEAFRESGFRVVAGFATDVVKGGEAYIAARSSGEHAVSVRVGDGLVDLRLVRAVGNSDARSDTGAEVEFCKDIGRVSAGLHGLGVHLQLVTHLRPGSVPVDVVREAEAVVRVRKRARSRSKHLKRIP